MAGYEAIVAAVTAFIISATTIVAKVLADKRVVTANKEIDALRDAHAAEQRANHEAHQEEVKGLREEVRHFERLASDWERRHNRCPYRDEADKEETEE